MLRFIKQWIIDTLGFSKSEANGTLVLILILILAIILPKLYINTQKTENRFDADQKELDQWAKELKAALILKEKHESALTRPTPAKSFPFDPNRTTRDNLLALGFSDRSTTNLLNYRQSGGAFRVKADLKKIYGISVTRVDELWDQIQLPEKIYQPNNDLLDQPEEKTRAAEKAELIDLNIAAAEEFRKVKGIGPVLSERIVKFRDKLGGFNRSDQLYEVYGLDSTVIATLIAQSTISGDLKTININTDSLKHLYQHPYIDYNLARAIFNYKSQRGKLDSVSEIKAIKILDEEQYQKIYPYLSINP